MQLAREGEDDRHATICEPDFSANYYRSLLFNGAPATRTTIRVVGVSAHGEFMQVVVAPK